MYGVPDALTVVTKMLVTGSVNFQPEAPFRQATAYIRVRDVSLADARAPVVAEQVIAGVCSGEGGSCLGFSLDFSARQKALYNLEAHISMSGTPEIKPGDYLTVQSYPIDPTPHPVRLKVEVRRVGRR